MFKEAGKRQSYYKEFEIVCVETRKLHTQKTDICHQNNDAFTPILPKWLFKILMYLLAPSYASTLRVNWVIESNK